MDTARFWVDLIQALDQDRDDIWTAVLQVLAGTEPEVMDMTYPDLPPEITPLWVAERAIRENACLWYPLRQLYGWREDAHAVADRERQRTVKMLATLVVQSVRRTRQELLHDAR